MQVQPEQSSFAVAYGRGENQVVWTELVADMDTAVSMMLKLTGAETYSFMLESVTGGEIRGRYSVIGARPDLIWRCRGEKAEINRAALHDRRNFSAESASSLDSLRSLIDECSMDMPASLPPMAAGLFGYLGYDCIRLVEHLPNVNPDPLGLPDAVMMRPSIIAIVDNIRDVVILCAPAWHDANMSADECYLAATNRLQDALTALDRAPALTPVTPAPNGPLRAIAPVSNTTHAEYLAMVEKAKDYVRAGDVFQVVPSQRWSMDLEVPPFALYRALRRLNPSPYMFYFDFDGFQVVGASPEILVRVKDDTVTIRPIAGTRPRGATPGEDDALEADLLADLPRLLPRHRRRQRPAQRKTRQARRTSPVHLLEEHLPPAVDQPQHPTHRRLPRLRRLLPRRLRPTRRRQLLSSGLLRHGGGLAFLSSSSSSSPRRKH
ncbi:MAG: chorismate-binding protein, partial [Pseudomonadota bacterium]